MLRGEETDMNGLDHSPKTESTAEEAAPSGPNLKLLFGLLALAIGAAAAIALLIVLPFYLRH